MVEKTSFQLQAELSLYPLEEPDVAKPIYRFVSRLEREGLNVRTGALSTLVSGEAAAVFNAVREAYCEVAGRGRHVLVVKFVNDAGREDP